MPPSTQQPLQWRPKAKWILGGWNRAVGRNSALKDSCWSRSLEEWIELLDMHRRGDQLPHRPIFPGLPPTSPIRVPRTGIHNVSIHSWDLQSPRPTLPWQTSHQIKNLIQLRVAFADKKLKAEAALCGQWHHAFASFSGYYKSSICPMFSSWIQLLSKVILVFWSRSRRSLPQLTTHHNLVYKVPLKSLNPWRFWCLMQGLGPWCGCGLLHADCLASGAILCYRWLGHLVKTCRDR